MRPHFPYRIACATGLTLALVALVQSLAAQGPLPKPIAGPLPDRLQRLDATPPKPAPATLPASALPANPPTALPAANALPAPLAATPVAKSTPARRAQVTFADGLLDVRADDSSLHQILRAICRQTGMTVTGGVEDQRIFGNYGPAAPATILATLLDGTGTNMILRESATDAPLQLYLTPRGSGGPTPPPFNLAAGDDDAPDTAPPPARSAPSPAVRSGYIPPPAPVSTPGQPLMPQPLNDINGNSKNVTPTASQIPTTDSVPIGSLPAPSTTPSSTGIVDTPNPPPAGSTTGTSPNGVKTPEQIYQQLLQMQQQKQQPASPTPNP
jgi:hypothetical protein